MTLLEFNTILQASVSPAIIISACGLLMLSMTNRYGRAIDRARMLVREREKADDIFKKSIQVQLLILGQRARIIRSAILFAALCILLIAVQVLVLFVGALIGHHFGFIASILFAASLLSLCISMVYFIMDIFRSLEAMEADINRQEPVDTSAAS